ncbi:hypothetical protein V202x_39730 [Gimesia aquarii]|uniref:Uncharacterized protein n=1 Tax=Gimesia aquarii TaxID=2527964 RepID=A0A517WZ84_9PLAN|nr:hypothetical protein V202x_39730 [Gimesia aquarii]
MTKWDNDKTCNHMTTHHMQFLKYDLPSPYRFS